MDAGFPNRNQPPARPPADHATGGPGRRNRGGVRDRQSVATPRGRGRWIRHAAAAGAVRALPVAMVEAPFGTALMAKVGGPQRPAAAERAARRRAVRMTAVTRRADGERTPALTAGLLTERFHGVGAREAVSDWTANPNRGTTALAASVCRSPGRSRGSGGCAGPSPRLTTAYATRTRRHAPGGSTAAARPGPSPGGRPPTPPRTTPGGCAATPAGIVPHHSQVASTPDGLWTLPAAWKTRVQRRRGPFRRGRRVSHPALDGADAAHRPHRHCSS